ncbi:hypothetical protein [Lactobacillus sp. PV037]|uniref:hypothetical protein n=1 Tax=Lactobacillus sp. PV037 TaxID=2594496 RepID=UPI00223EB3F4|nr:hypothetical protein [Lactobacillus sp. PV037]
MIEEEFILQLSKLIADATKGLLNDNHQEINTALSKELDVIREYIVARNLFNKKQ